MMTNQMNIVTYGKTVLGIPLTAFIPRVSRVQVAITCCLHGDEIESAVLSSAILSKLSEVKHKPAIAVFAPINADGFSHLRRWNANMVDLNRNFPTRDWTPTPVKPRYPPGPAAGSEPEVAALTKILQEMQPSFVLDLHSFDQSILLPSLYEHDSSITDSIAKLGASLDVKVEYDEDGLGYNAPGGIHTWCVERGINNITLEVQKSLGQTEIVQRYLQPTLGFLDQLINIGEMKK